MDKDLLLRILFWLIIVGAIVFFWLLFYLVSCLCRGDNPSTSQISEIPSQAQGSRHGRRRRRREDPETEQSSSEQGEEVPRENRKQKKKRKIAWKKDAEEGEADSEAVRVVLPQTEPSRTAVHMTFLNL
ncbi:hypothetical protein J6590_026530 [Homalodisca vitripennis]|nr:hypothetical protein J6590_026530 [Homalodisca vitripennis]